MVLVPGTRLIAAFIPFGVFVPLPEMEPCQRVVDEAGDGHNSWYVGQGAQETARDEPERPAGFFGSTAAARPGLRPTRQDLHDGPEFSSEKVGQTGSLGILVSFFGLPANEVGRPACAGLNRGVKAARPGPPLLLFPLPLLGSFGEVLGQILRLLDRVSVFWCRHWRDRQLGVAIHGIHHFVNGPLGFRGRGHGLWS